jgi:hypothetical protein
LARNLPYLEKLTRDLPSEASEIFDLPKLTRVLEEVSLGGPNARHLQRLDHTLAFLKWLSLEHSPDGSSSVAASQNTDRRREAFTCEAGQARG